MATKSEIIDLIDMLSVYYNVADRMNETQTKVYLNTLDDIPTEILELATYDHIARSQWFPKVSELREAAVRVRSNNARPLEYDEFEVEDPSTLPYWRAMSLFNASLRGDITEENLYDKPRVAKVLELACPKLDDSPALPKADKGA